VIRRPVRGVLIGRFQPFHLGHLAVVREIRTTHPDQALVLGVGSAQASYSWKDPFTAGERLEMIAAALEEASIREVVAVPVPDIDRHALWVAHVESLLPSFQRVYTNNPLTRVLFERAGYPVERPKLVDRERFEGEHVRAALASDAGWRELVPSAVAQRLTDLGATERLRLLRGSTDPPTRPGGS
jgi:nicotinamide-nucleotide adenylyltransferase